MGQRNLSRIAHHYKLDKYEVLLDYMNNPSIGTSNVQSKDSRIQINRYNNRMSSKQSFHLS